jgi:protoporphyrinogen oxidase
MNRRDLLTAFLGSTVAASACKRHVNTNNIPVRFVDGAHEHGHLLRGNALQKVTQVTRTVDCLIVGGGAAGLSAAWRLHGAGITNFIMAELEGALGGTAQNGESEVTKYPWGAHYLPAPLSSQGPVPKLLKEMGVMVSDDANGRPEFAEECLIHDPEERLFFKGQWYEGLYLRAGASADDLIQLERFNQLMSGFARAKDSKGRKAFAVPIAFGSDENEFTHLDSVSMATWLQNEKFTSARLLWMVDYGCCDDYGSTSANTSAWAAIWYFAARQTGDEKNEGFLSWPEGNGRLMTQLKKSLNPNQIQSSHLVFSVEENADSSVSAHVVDVKTKQVTHIKARTVILAIPRFVAARLMPARIKADGFNYSPWVVANIHVNALPKGRGYPLAWDNVFYESNSLGYVVATHQMERGRASDNSVLTWYAPQFAHDAVSERKKMLAASAEEYRDIILSDFTRAHAHFGDSVSHVEVMRWGHAMPRPVPGFIWSEKRKLAHESGNPNIHLAHSDLSGLALFEESNYHGVRAAENVLRVLALTPLHTWL